MKRFSSLWMPLAILLPVLTAQEVPPSYRLASKNPPLPVGEVYALNLPGMDDVNLFGGKITLTFLGVEEFAGEPCAIIKAKFKFAGQLAEEQMKGVGMDADGTFKITRSLKYFDDYKVSGRFGISALGEMQAQPGMVATFKMNGDSKFEVDTVREKPAE